MFYRALPSGAAARMSFEREAMRSGTVPIRAAGFVALGLWLALASAANARREVAAPQGGPERKLCTGDEGEFHPVPWRVPPSIFAGYHCVWYPQQPSWDPAGVVVSLDPTDTSLLEPSRLCTTVYHGSFATIATFAYYGYACTWLP